MTEPLPTDSLESSRPGGGTKPQQAQDVSQRSFGKYRIRSQLGSGAFGTVYLARDETLQREVALKIPSRRAMQNSAFRERFLREARASAALDHPNICPIYEVGDVSGTPFFAMAYCRGGTLRQIMERKARFSEKQAVALVRKLALALAHAHQAGIIHRDLKPENILINEQGQPVISDFGLAKRIQVADPTLTKTGKIVGTPAYMSPEQARGEKHTPASDIFSLGVIFYELLCGRRPYEGDLNMVLLKIASPDDPPLHPYASRSDLSAETAEICMRCLSKDPTQRFGSMRELADALRAQAAELSKLTSSDGTVHSQTDRVLNKLVESLTQSDSGGNHRVVPLSMWIAGSVLTASILFVLMFFLFRSESGKVRFQFQLDTSDPSLTVKIDGQEVDTASLTEGIELPPGPHELVVYRDDREIQRYAFTVQRGMTTVERLESLNGPRPPPGERHLITRILAAGGEVSAQGPDGKEYSIRPGASLPSEEVYVHAIRFPAGTSVDDSIAELMADASRVAQIDVENAAGLTTDGLEAFRTLDKLTSVRLVGLRCDLEPILNWPWLSGVTHLDLSESRRVSGIMARLGPLPELESLTLRDTRLDASDLAVIGGHASLQRLHLDRVPLAPSDAENWGRLTNLSELSLAGTEICLSELPLFGDSLREVQAAGSKTTDQAGSWLADHRGLQVLDVSRTESGGDLLEAIFELPALRELTMAETRLTDVDVARQPPPEELEKWNVTGSFVSAQGVSRFRELQTKVELSWNVEAARDLSLEVRHAVEAAGGSVSEGGEAEAGDDPFDPRVVPQGTGSLRQLILRDADPETLSLLPLIGRLPDLLSLELTGLPVRNEDLRHLRHLQQLKRLDLSRTAITDDGLEQIGLLNSLVELDLQGNSIQGEGIRFLESLPLRTLRIGSPPDGRVRLTDIARLSSLAQLELNDIPLSELIQQVPSLPATLQHLGSSASRDEDIPELRRYEGITSLNLSGSPLTDESVTDFARLRQLQTLDLSHTALTGSTINLLENRPITSLRLAGLPLVPRAVLGLASLKRLKSLDLSETPVDNVSLVALTQLSSLNSLDVTDAWTTRTGRRHFREQRPDCRLLPDDLPEDAFRARQLAGWVQEQGGELTVQFPDGRLQRVGQRASIPAGQFTIIGIHLLRSPLGIDDSGFRRIADEGNLRVLEVYGSGATDAALAQLQELPMLQSLTLDHVGLTDRGFRYLLACPRLKTLRLNEAKLTSDSLPMLQKLQQLESLQLGRSGWDSTILDALVGIPGLRKLDIDFPLGNQARKLQQLGALEHLVFTRCGQLRDSDIAILANLDKIRELTIRQSRLDPQARRRLAALNRITSLELEDVPLEAGEFRYLAGLRQLRQLRLTDMNVDQQAVKQLGTMRQLLKLTLRRCHVSDDDAIALRQTLPRCDVQILEN